MTKLEVVGLTLIPLIMIGIAIALATKINKDHFDKYPANRYFRAIWELRKIAPRSTAVIIGGYLLMLVVVLVFKVLVDNGAITWQS